MNALILVEGRDPTGQLLGDALADLGHSSSIVDIGQARLSVRTGSEPALTIDGRPTEPDLVVNRTSVNGHGLASPALLRHQPGATWFERHTTARERQGLLLAVLDHLGRSARVLDPPAAAEHLLMRNRVVEILAARGIPVATPDVDDGVVRVAAGRIVMAPGDDRPSAHLREASAALAEAGRFDMATVTHRAGVLTGWSLPLDLNAPDLPTARAMARSVVTTCGVGAIGPPTTRPTRPFITDMVDRFAGE